MAKSFSVNLTRLTYRRIKRKQHIIYETHRENREDRGSELFETYKRELFSVLLHCLICICCVVKRILDDNVVARVSVSFRPRSR